MLLATLVAALVVSRILIRPLIEPLGVLNQVARQLAKAAPSLELDDTSDQESEQIAAVFQNVSQHVAAHIADLQTEQHRLEQSHDRLAIVLEAMIEGVIAVDRDERILLANAAAVRLLDLNSNRISNHPLWEAVRLPRLQELVRDSIAGLEQHRLEFEVPRTQSTVVAVVSRLPGKPCPGAVIVLHDVTDLRRLESLRREFVSNVSHELKTPLAAISAYTETLLDGALEEPGINRGFVTRIEEQAERLNTLILDLLELARVETNNHAYEIEPIDIGKTLVASISEHQNIAASKNLRLIAVQPAAPTWALADPGGLRTIVDNLIDNAINYTPEGGEVKVEWHQMGDAVSINVIDTGVGIAKEYQTRIFERFYRVDRARSREVGGTGLGLAIVKHLCQVFNGEIRVSSRLGHGSTFTVRLKAAAPVAN
ncbi:MAG: PAS domain-containing protein [Planctomycetes bacterium]|nr:PAS domain-containing protein [Planctomycetota bacterium]